MPEPSLTLEAYQFMREHGAHWYRPAAETEEQGRVRSALQLARVERALRRRGGWVSWEPDPDGTAAGKHPAWIACLLRWPNDGGDAEPVAALGGIDANEGDPYRRVVEAELALEAGL
jgi:hypothetical protein